MKCREKKIAVEKRGEDLLGFSSITKEIRRKVCAFQQAKRGWHGPKKYHGGGRQPAVPRVRLKAGTSQIQ